MSISLDEFAKRVSDSGILSAQEVSVARLSLGQNATRAEDLAKSLIASQLLTRYQAQMIAHGKAGSLVLGNYVLLDRIGSGGMGQVFKAEHRHMKRIVAVKLLSSAALADERSVTRFHREVQAAAQLVHPHIVTAYDAGKARGIHYLVMEFVAGTDLYSLVKQRGPLRGDQAVSYVIQAARGLAFAHGKGIVHRDVKPSNLLLDEQGTVKILDMGLALIGRTTDATQTALTQAGSVVGTIDYLAPEQALSSREVDHRADIYSLGCTLFYLLTGQPPYPRDSAVKTLLAHREAPVRSLRDVRPDLPAALDQVLARMTAKQAEMRFGSMQEVITALEASLSQPGPQPLTGVRPPVMDLPLPQSLAVTEDFIALPKQAASPRRQRSPKSRSTTGIALGICGWVALTAAALVGWWTWLRQPTTHQRPVAQAPVSAPLSASTGDGSTSVPGSAVVDDSDSVNRPSAAAEPHLAAAGSAAGGPAETPVPFFAPAAESLANEPLSPTNPPAAVPAPSTPAVAPEPPETQLTSDVPLATVQPDVSKMPAPSSEPASTITPTEAADPPAPSAATVSVTTSDRSQTTSPKSRTPRSKKKTEKDPSAKTAGDKSVFSVEIILPDGRSETFTDPKQALEQLQLADPTMVIGIKYYFPLFLNWMQNNVRGGVAAAPPPLQQIFNASMVQGAREGMIPPRMRGAFEPWYEAFMKRGADNSQDRRIILTIHQRSVEYWLPSDVIPVCQEAIAQQLYDDYQFPDITPRVQIAGFHVGGMAGGGFPPGIPPVPR